MCEDEKLKKVFKLMLEAKELLKGDLADSEKVKEIDMRTYELRCGCYDALTVLAVAIKEEFDGINKDKRESARVVDGLLSSAFKLAKHYEISISDAIENSGLFCGELETADTFF